MAEAAHCQCGPLSAPSVYAVRGRCVIECGTEIGAKYVFCRPCAKGNHTGLPCSNAEREPVFHLNNAQCANCGVDLALHETDSTGRKVMA